VTFCCSSRWASVYKDLWKDWKINHFDVLPS